MNLEQLRKYKPQIEAIAAKYGVTNIRVFGSVARGDAGENSDVDFLVDYKKDIRIKDIMAFDEEFYSLTKYKVDMVSAKSASLILQKYIKDDLVQL